jgi:ribonuclease G
MLLQTNVEAAYEVARQLRLRNIGGLVVVDFIDMRHRRDQQAVYRAMKDRLRRDKAKTQVLQISAVGLMEMTRQRLNESLRETLLEPCPYCQGRGKVKTTMTMSVEIQRALNTVIQRKHEDEIGDMVVVVNPEVLNRFKSEDSSLLMDIERSHTGRLIFRSDPNLHRERYGILDAASEKTLAQG